MRHLSGARPRGWDDNSLAQRIDQPAADFTRGQQLLDQVAEQIGQPATPEPYWWLRT